MTDQDLLRAYINSRDVDSLGAFVTRHQDSLVCFVTRFMGDRHAAQDVVQETFLKVARHPRHLLDVENCHNWLLRVAHNIGVDHQRKAARQRKHIARVADGATGRDTTTVPDSQVAAVEAAENRERTHAEIARLSPRHREVLLLRIQEEKSYHEIAEITGLSATNVGFLLHQAMTELTKRLRGSKGENR